jgi:hypothetical protein
MDPHNIPYITFEEFKEYPRGGVFKVVTTIHHNYTVASGEELTFVCKKGYGYDDWSIYYGPSSQSAFLILASGTKLQSDERILMIFPCDEETLSRYRK